MIQSRRWSQEFWITVRLLLVIPVVTVPYIVLSNSRYAVPHRDYPEDLRLLMAMRKQNPIVPLGQRVPKPNGVDASFPAISGDAERELKNYESHFEQSLRRYRLRR